MHKTDKRRNYQLRREKQPVETQTEHAPSRVESRMKRMKRIKNKGFTIADVTCQSLIVLPFDQIFQSVFPQIKITIK